MRYDLLVKARGRRRAHREAHGRRLDRDAVRVVCARAGMGVEEHVLVLHLVKSLLFWFHGLQFRVEGLLFWVSGLWFMVYGLWFMVCGWDGSGCMVKGLGFGG